MAALICAKCGASNAADDVFCSKCGTLLRATPAYPSPTQPQAAPPQQWSPVVQGYSGGSPSPQWGPASYSAGSTHASQPQKPTASMVLGIIGGVFIIAAGVLEIIVGTEDSSLTFGIVGGTYIASGLLGLIVGILVLVFGILVYIQPQHHVVYGVLILVFSIISLVSFAGGFFIGFLLGLIGGILAIVHNPFPGQMMAQPSGPLVQRICPRCGRVIDPSVRFCPHCGNQLG